MFDDLEALAEVLVASQLPWVATAFYLRDMERQFCSLKFFLVLLQQFVGISCRSFCYLQAKSGSCKAIFNDGDEQVGEEAWTVNDSRCILQRISGLRISMRPYLLRPQKLLSSKCCLDLW